jgi:hypothetical protein
MRIALATNQHENAMDEQGVVIEKTPAKAPWREIFSAPHQICPELVRPAFYNGSPERFTPIAIISVLRPPRPQSLRCLPQRVFAREPDRAVHLMGY